MKRSFKATHKQIVNVYKGLGYIETSWYPCAEITVMGRATGKDYSPVECKTIIKTQVFDGIYDEYTDCIIDPDDMKGIKLDKLLTNQWELP